jgi:hypothetical protein
LDARTETAEKFKLPSCRTAERHKTDEFAGKRVCIAELISSCTGVTGMSDILALGPGRRFVARDVAPVAGNNIDGRPNVARCRERSNVWTLGKTTVVV